MSRSLRLRTAFCTVCLLAWPVLVWASEEGSGRDPWVDLGLKFVNFGILVGMLYYFLHKPVRQALADRHESVRKALDDARTAKAAAEAKAHEYGQRVANLEQEIAGLREEVRTEAERQKAQIVQEAQTAAASIRRQAEASGVTEVKRAQDALRSEVGELAVQLAEALLSKSYTEQDQKQALQLTIANVEGIH